MGTVVHVALGKATQSYGPISDAHACAMAYPYALSQGAGVIEVQGEGEVFPRRYTLQQVRELLQAYPDLRALGGFGKPEPTKRVAQAGGRYIYLGRQRQTAGGILTVSR